MKRVAAGLVALSVICLIAGCAMPQTSPTYGGVVTTNVGGPVAGVDNAVGMSKMGTAESTAIVFFASGDASIKAAMEQGGLTKVHHVDCEVFSVLGLYSKYKTIVYGE
jgi:hypothetical protein